jgi:fluoroacetyl-CoA thioesterase
MGLVKDTMQQGIDGFSTHVVTSDMSAPHLPVVVLSTPSMIGLIEQTCLQTAAEHLDEGETTVGTHVCVSHDAAAMEGEEFEVTCLLTKVDGRRLTFTVEVNGQRGRLSTGTHQRAVVPTARFSS